MLEKVGGFFTIVIAVTGLALISVYEPPVYAQIILALLGSFVCLVGVVFMFAEGQIFEHRRGKKASQGRCRPRRSLLGGKGAVQRIVIGAVSIRAVGCPMLQGISTRMPRLNNILLFCPPVGSHR